MENDSPHEEPDSEALRKRKEKEFLNHAFHLLESTAAEMTAEDWTWEIVQSLFYQLEKAFDPDFYAIEVVYGKDEPDTAVQKRRDDLVLERQRQLARAFMVAGRTLCLRYADVLRQAPKPPAVSEEERRAGFLEIVDAALDKERLGRSNELSRVAPPPSDIANDVRAGSQETVGSAPETRNLPSADGSRIEISANCETITAGGLTYPIGDRIQRKILAWYRSQPQNPNNLCLQEIAVDELKIGRRNSDLSRVFGARKIRELIFEPVKEFSSTYRMAAGVAFLAPDEPSTESDPRDKP